MYIPLVRHITTYHADLRSKEWLPQILYEQGARLWVSTLENNLLICQ